ncbi:cytochrome P450 [Aspergillus costaricaensis CBS 115574]|uniref:cytochrome P450 n=1 Tax=Aspergillus costaricaensis CBS 115574 TaxID=1448317 RepID=UPI000DBD66FF|nr:cytochrome P450 [Aspergillus costaricaensis CBS 115574]RAK90524.1 cytochrome P450 [Aspergillus costaricaensis CBS 115574]
MFSLLSIHLPIQAFYLFIFAGLIRLLKLLWKTPFPTNAPRLVPGYPVVGAFQFFFNRAGFCHDNKAASARGNYSYYLGQHRIVGLSGPQGRKTFFESRDLDMDEGILLLLPFAGIVRQIDNPSSDTHTSCLRSTLRRALMRSQALNSTPQVIGACTTAALDRIAARGLINPFQELKWLFAQTTMAALGLDEVVHFPELSRKVSDLISITAQTFPAIDLLVPPLLNPLHIPAMIAAGRLYVITWRIIHKQKQQQHNKLHPGGEDMLHDMFERGRRTIAIVQGNSPTVVSWILTGLATNAYWMARARGEVDQVILRHRKDGEGVEQVLRSLDLQTWEHEFPVLHACLLESVRLSLLLVEFRKNISTTDVQIGDTGEIIPPGAYVTYELQETSRDPDVYPNPDRWDPGRFLSDRAEYAKEAHAFAGFGAGRRKCRE